MRPEIREGFASRNILYICLGLPQVLLLVHFLDALRVYITTGQFPHLLYQACIDPASHYSIPFYTLLPFQVIMTYIYIIFGAYNNIYLYRFLRFKKEVIKHSLAQKYLNRIHEGKVTGKLKSESDLKRERKRNLVPAKTGIYIVILIGIYSIIHTVSYFSFSDSGTREYFLSLAVDLLSCIIAPGIIVFQAPTITRKMNKTFSSFMQHISTKISTTGSSTGRVSSETDKRRNTENSRHNNG